jgi:hypothetical protein
MINKTDFKINILELEKLLPLVKWDNDNRALLNEPTGHWLYDPYTILESWKGTAFEDLLNEIPYNIGEARLMKLMPEDAYRAHADADNRLYINITGNEYCYLIDLNNSKMHQVLTDGHLYFMDAGLIHTAVNFGCTPRIQLVIRLLLKRNLSPEYITTSIKIKNPPYNLRYLLDKHISPVLNKLANTGEIGFFDPVSTTVTNLVLSKNALVEIENRLKILNLSYEFAE